MNAIARSVGSNLSASSITINAKNKALIQGSNLNAKENIGIKADEVEITAARDTKESKSSKDHAHFTQTYSVYGGANSTFSADRNENSSKSSTYTNARLNGNNISITSKQDTHVTGAVVKAKDELTLDVGGNLKVASLQDRSRSKSASVGGSVGSNTNGSTNKPLCWVEKSTSRSKTTPTSKAPKSLLLTKTGTATT